jgi:hypothetical protein
MFAYSLNSWLGMIGDKETIIRRPSKFLIVGLYLYYIASPLVNGDDSHENFEFIRAGIPKGNSTRSQIGSGEVFKPAEVADEIQEVRKESVFRGAARV